MIRFESIVKTFGDVTAVESLDLTIGDGEFLCIIGPSGSGKTSTLRMLAGLERPTSGQIWVGGDDVTDWSPRDRELPMVWQLFVLFPHMTVEENIGYGLKFRNVGKAERRERIERIAESLGVMHLLARRPGQLSGGEQQRVGLARALVLEPKVLLLDEPLGSVDAKFGLVVQGQLKEIQRRLGITFVYVTHNEREALAMGDRIVVMNRGRVEQIGTASELIGQPQTRFVAEFVGQNNVLDATVVAASSPHSAVECGFGTVHGRLRAGEIAPGQSAAYIVPAEYIDLQRVNGGPPAPADPGSNRLEGIARGEDYHGSMTLVAVEVEGGGTLRVDVPSSQRPELGESVSISWKADDAVILPEPAPDLAVR